MKSRCQIQCLKWLPPVQIFQKQNFNSTHVAFIQSSYWNTSMKLTFFVVCMNCNACHRFTIFILFKIAIGIQRYIPGTNNQTLELPSQAWRRNKPLLPTCPSGQSWARSSWIIVLAQHFIRQARTGRDAHLKVLIRYRSTMSVIFIYLCHLICLGVISALSFVSLHPAVLSKCVTVGFSLCPFLSVLFVWSEMSHGCLITLTESQSEQ